MTSWSLTLRSDAAVSVAASRERGFHTPTLPYVPGGTLRGALAAAWIARHGRPAPGDQVFQRDVVDLRVGPAIVNDAVLVPLDHWVCKYREQPQCAAVVIAPAHQRPDLRCPHCGGPMTGSKGEWANVDLRTTVRTSLTSDETPEDSHLFSRSALSAGQTFHAVAHGDLSWLAGQEVSLRVGGDRSISGRMTIQVAPHEVRVPETTGTRVRICMSSPGVFLDHMGRNCLRPTPGDLARALDVGTEEAPRLVASWSRPTMVAGWNSAAGLPKSSELGACAGSVFEFEFGDVVGQDQLRQLVMRGLGVRRADGYGWITVGDYVISQRSVAEAVPSSHDRALGLAERLSEYAPQDVKRVMGWLRDGESIGQLRSSVAFTDLNPELQVLCGEVLAFADGDPSGRDRQRLVILLENRS